MKYLMEIYIKQDAGNIIITRDVDLTDYMLRSNVVQIGINGYIENVVIDGNDNVDKAKNFIYYPPNSIQKIIVNRRN